MPKRYRVKRTFPHRDRLFRGQIITDPNFPNLRQLVRTGYFEELPDDEVTELPLTREVQNEIPAVVAANEIKPDPNSEAVSGSKKAPKKKPAKAK